jgi:hypothetical protein
MNLPSMPQFDVDTIIIAIYNSPSLQTVILGIFLFFMIFLFALSRRYLIHSSMKGVHAGIIIGIVLLAGIEGGGVYAMKEFTKAEKGQIVPPNIRALLSTSQQQAVQVLGAESERQIPTAQSVVSDFQDLSKLDAKLVKDSICKPQSAGTGTIE